MATEKLYYKDPYQTEFDAQVLSCESAGDRILIRLDRSCFYPEGGGQPADIGTLGGLTVTDVHEKDGEILHTCIFPAVCDPNAAAGQDSAHDPNAACGLNAADGSSADESTSGSVRLPLPGDRIHGRIDWAVRFDHMQQHSGEHIVSGMLCSRFHCNNVGFHMGSETVTIDYDTVISEEELREVELAANRYLWENHAFVELWPDAEELEKLEYRSKKALSGAVRIAVFPGADCCACCGTHVKQSGEVGLVKFLSVQKFRDGVRIEMLSGGRAFRYLSSVYEQNRLCSQASSSKPLETGEAVSQMKQELIRLKGRIVSLENDVFNAAAASLEGADSPVYFTGELESDALRKLCVRIASRARGLVRVFAGSGTAYKYALICEGADLRNYVKELNTALCGRGGGKDGFAQGSVNAGEAEIRAFLETHSMQ